MQSFVIISVKRLGVVFVGMVKDDPYFYSIITYDSVSSLVNDDINARIEAMVEARIEIAIETWVEATIEAQIEAVDQSQLQIHNLMILQI